VEDLAAPGQQIIGNDPAGAYLAAPQQLGRDRYIRILWTLSARLFCCNG
jgi:hypothetical protein